MSNKPQYMAMLAFLNAIGTSATSPFTQEFKSKLAQNKIRPVDTELVLRKQIGNSGGKVNLLEGELTREVGINSFDGKRLNENRIAVISEVTLNYGVAPAGTSPIKVEYTTALPPDLLAGELRLKQNGELIFTLPISSINEAKSTDSRYRELGGFQFLRDNAEIEVELYLPQNTDLAPGAGNAGFIEIFYKGYETQQKL